jgi:hypothetical protein
MYRPDFRGWTRFSEEKYSNELRSLAIRLDRIQTLLRELDQDRLKVEHYFLYAQREITNETPAKRRRLGEDNAVSTQTLARTSEYAGECIKIS